MGQRANYIIKEGNNLTIHYNHWRANCILSDLYLGEKRFLNFVDKCQMDDTIMNEPWIEGCVIIDKSSNQLHFWTLDFPKETSVIKYYLNELNKKWDGWQINFLKKRMYDAEILLGINYIAIQELPELHLRSKEDIINDKVEEWKTAVVILKDGSDLLVTKTGNLGIEAIVSYGQEVVTLLRNKNKYSLPNEGDDGTDECIVIDISNKKIFINESYFGLWEQSKKLWDGFSLTMGDFGYIETLRLGGIETSTLEMANNKIIEQFKRIIKPSQDFDPFQMAKKLIKEDKNIQFNPGFFDNVKPLKTTLEKVKLSLMKILGRH